MKIWRDILRSKFCVIEKRDQKRIEKIEIQVFRFCSCKMFKVFQVSPKARRGRRELEERRLIRGPKTLVFENSR